RRLGAFCVDFLLVLACISPVLGLIPILAEWRRTGVFAWSFVRASPAPGDSLLSVLTILLAIPALLVYFVCPLMRSRPSPGSCVLGYQIIGDGGTRITPLVALKRTVLGFTFLGDRKAQVVRIDRWFGTHAVKLK
ncbi:MAG: RDD family protein, partial [Terracidiphilus sp.]